MKIDGALLGAGLAQIGAVAQQLEAQGFDGVVSFEGPHDPFLQLAPAATCTARVRLVTGVAIAFARNPMTCAYAANDLQLLSQGRFVLGLGTQVRAHIERRFGQTWSRPDRRMREFVLALRAIWDAWRTGGRLDFRGEFFTHTLMGPFFDPGPNPHGTPPVHLAGFGPSMIAVAGEVADGWIIHPLHSPEYVRATALPALQRGRARATAREVAFEISAQTITLLASNDEELARARTKARAQIAFYSATPTYRVMLEHHGWEGLQPELNQLARSGQWGEMIARIPDAMLETITVGGSPAQVARALRERNGFADRTSLVLYNETEPEAVVELLRALHD